MSLEKDKPCEPGYAFPPDYATTMVHFYRGELGRMMVWRQRFDTTTHWAIIGLTGIVSFAWNHAELGNFLFLFAHPMLYLLLNIEARRYRFYDAYRARVRMLESHFIFPVVTLSGKRLEGDWRHLMGEDLILPSFKIRFMEALARRFRRNYIWIYLLLAGAWAAYIVEIRGAASVAEFLKQLCANQPLPPWLLLSGIGGFYLYLFGVYLYGHFKRTVLGEFQKRPSGGNWQL